MSMLRTVGMGIAWNTLASILVKVFTLANVFLIVSHLTVYDYGLTQLVISVFSTVAGLLLPGLGSVLIADLARDRGAWRIAQLGTLARQYLVLQIILGTLAFLILFAGSLPLAAYIHRPDIGYYLVIIAFLFLTSPFLGVLGVLAAAELRFGLQSALSVLGEAIKLLFLLIFFYGFGLGISGVLLSMVLTPLVISVVTLPWAWKSFKPLISAPPAEESIWKLMTSHRLWGIASSYLATLTQNLRLWFIQLFLGTEAVAFFSFAQGLFSQASALITFGVVTNPVLAHAAHDPERLGDFTMRTLKYHVWIALAALVPGMIVTPFFIHWFFPAYAPAILISVIYLLVLIPGAVNIATTAAYTALQKQREYFFRATLVRSVSIAILTPPLLLLFGLIGSAIEPILTLSISTFERIRMLRLLLPSFVPSLSTLFVYDATDRALVSRLMNRLRPLGDARTL